MPGHWFAAESMMVQIKFCHVPIQKMPRFARSACLKKKTRRRMGKFNRNVNLCEYWQHYCNGEHVARMYPKWVRDSRGKHGTSFNASCLLLLARTNSSSRVKFASPQCSNNKQTSQSHLARHGQVHWAHCATELINESCCVCVWAKEHSWELGRARKGGDPRRKVCPSCILPNAGKLLLARLVCVDMNIVHSIQSGHPRAILATVLYSIIVKY